jgi:hypothetical protein
MPDLPGDGPHGLAVSPSGDVHVGDFVRAGTSESAVEGYRVRRLREGAVEAFPVIPFEANKGLWDLLLGAEPRLRATSAPRAVFDLGAMKLRLAYDEGRRRWDADPEPSPELPASSGTDGRRPYLRGGAALAFDENGRPLRAWADEERVHVVSSDGQAWVPLDDALPPAVVRGRPAVAASSRRVCVAWASEGFAPTVFVRCHALTTQAKSGMERQP